MKDLCTVMFNKINIKKGIVTIDSDIGPFHRERVNTFKLSRRFMLIYFIIVNCDRKTGVTLKRKKT